MKRLLLFSVALLGVSLAHIAFAYTPLVGIPGIDPATQGVEQYVNAIYWLSIVAGAFLAVLKIIIGGVKWMFSEGVTSKTDARKDITGAIFGLLIILAAVLVLNTINPHLTCFSIFGGEGRDCVALSEGVDPEVIESDPILTVVTFGTVINRNRIEETNFRANCAQIGGVVTTTDNALQFACYADTSLIDPAANDVFNPLIYHPDSRPSAQAVFRSGCAENDLIYVASDNSCRASLVTGELVVGSRLSIVGVPSELVTEAWGIYTFQCPDGRASQSPTELGCYANPTTINAGIDDVFDPTLYRGGDRAEAQERFENSCEENGHTFVESDVSCRDNTPNATNCAAEGLIYVSSQEACAASLVQSEIVIGSQVRIQGAPSELVSDVAIRYQNGCPGRAETTEDGVFMRCYAPINSINANAGDVLNLETYGPSQRAAAETAFQTSCEEKDFVYTATDRKCNFPGFDFDPLEPLPLRHYCRPFEGNYRCALNANICGDNDRCLFIYEDELKDMAFIRLESANYAPVYVVATCGTGANASCYGGGSQSNSFNSLNAMILLQNPEYLSGVDNPLTSGEGGSDFQSMANTILMQFRAHCTAISGTITENQALVSSHPQHPTLTGKIACTPPAP